MANKIKLTRGTKANIEANKSSLETYQIVYATDTSEIGVKKADGNVDYFMNATYINTDLAGKANATHTHTKSQITDFPTSMPPTAHTHDDRYYTENEVDTKLAGKANATHTHNQYLTEETDPTVPEWAKTEPPSAVRYMKMNTNNTITWRTAAQLRGDIGAATPANITTAVSTHNESPTAHQDIRTSLSKKLPQEVIFGANDKPETTIRVTNIRNDQNTVQAIHIHDSGDITLGGPFGEYPNTIISKAKLGYDPSDPSDVVDKYYVDSKTMKLINSGSSTALSKTGYITFTVPSDSYAGKTVAVEIKYGSSSSTTYTNKVIYVTLGTNTSTEASKTYPRFITLSEWDGEYLKHISVKTYVAAGTTSTINFGHVKTLIGRFTGSTIDWTTQANDNINVYIGKIWLVG